MTEHCWLLVPIDYRDDEDDDTPRRGRGPPDHAGPPDHVQFPNAVPAHVREMRNPAGCIIPADVSAVEIDEDHFLIKCEWENGEKRRRFIDDHDDVVLIDSRNELPAVLNERFNREKTAEEWTDLFDARSV